jgi:hypothetical protein
MHGWFSLCFNRSVVRRAAYSAVIVGAVLVTINHGDALLTGKLDPTRLFRIILTIMVPYIVSTVSSVITLLELKNEAI